MSWWVLQVKLEFDLSESENISRKISRGTSYVKIETGFYNDVGSDKFNKITSRIIDLILEWIVLGVITWKGNYELAQKVQGLFPLTSMSNLIKQPFQRIAMTKFPGNSDIIYDYSVHFETVLLVMVWTLLFVYSSYRLLKKRDL